MFLSRRRRMQRERERVKERGERRKDRWRTRRERWIRKWNEERNRSEAAASVCAGRGRDGRSVRALNECTVQV